jgi:hypothetical protein
MQRKDLVIVKGKGELVTFFLNNKTSCDAGSNHDSFRIFGDEDLLGAESAEVVGFHRITEWTAEVMAGLLKDIVSSRKLVGFPRRSQANLAALEHEVSLRSQNGKFTVIDEVQEIIELPDFHDRWSARKTHVGDVMLDPQARQELRDYIRAIALMYNDNRKLSSFIIDWDPRISYNFLLTASSLHT